MDIDLQLKADAQRLITGANVHRIGSLMFCYEAAVYRCNEGRTYDQRFEESLREFVVLETRRRRVVEGAEAGPASAAELAAKSARLNRRISDLLHTHFRAVISVTILGELMSEFAGELAVSAGLIS